MEDCKRKETYSATTNYIIIIPQVTAKIGLFSTLMLAALLTVNYASPIVKASSVPIIRILVAGMLFSFFSLYVVSSACTPTACILFRFFNLFGLVSRYMAITLYVARLHRMTGSGNKKNKNCCMKAMDKVFNVLGHAKAVQIVPWIVWILCVIIFIVMLVIYPENDDTMITDPQHYWSFLTTDRMCAFFLDFKCTLPNTVLVLIFLSIAMAICVQAKAASEFLRQDRQVLSVFLFFVYCSMNVLIAIIIAGTEQQVKFFAILIFSLVEVWTMSIIVWYKRVYILACARELNTRENVTRIATSKGKMANRAVQHRNQEGGEGAGAHHKFSISRLVHNRRQANYKGRNVSFGSIRHSTSLNNETQTPQSQAK